MIKNIPLYKERLEEEKRIAQAELKKAKSSDTDSVRSDASDVADRIEAYDENRAVTRDLDKRLGEIEAALEKIAVGDGSYGTCSVCGKEIEENRLRANPAATTCKEHMQ